MARGAGWSFVRRAWSCLVVFALCSLGPVAASALALTPPGNGNGVVQISWGASSSQLFSYTGAEQTFAVPAGVSSLKVQAIGANGGDSDGVKGGIGASVSGTISVPSGHHTLYVNVGGRGQDGYQVCPGGKGGTFAAGGFNGGGDSPRSNTLLGAGFRGGGGGGASDVQTLTNTGWLFAAGGGGGAGGPGENGCSQDSLGGAGGSAGANGFNGSGTGGAHFGGQFGCAPLMAGPPCYTQNGGGVGGGGGGGGNGGGVGSNASGGEASGGGVGGSGGGVGEEDPYVGGDGGGAGGGNYGGGGGGGGGASDPTNKVVGDGGGGGGSGGSSLVPASPQQISGQITTPFGDGLAGATVQLSGSENQSVTTDQNGNYSFSVNSGTYTVTPVPASSAGDDEYSPTACPGTSVTKPPAACQGITIAANQSATANFSAAFTLTGQVTGLDGNGVANAKVSLTEVDQSGVTKIVTATTNSEGQIVSSGGATSLGVVLAPGTALVSAVGSDGTQYYPVPSGGTNPDCVPTNLNCRVTLDRDRNIAFSACVVPNPNGSPLPAGTPTPIPGAVVASPLEAVGCWVPQGGNSQTATIFTSDTPIRLDGIDVNPSPGTTFTLNTGFSTPVVTSNGPAQLLIGGWPVTLSHQISLSYGNGVSPAGGGGVSIGDLGAGTGPLSPSLIAPNAWGLPIALGTGGPAGYGLPFVESTGQTVINLGAQFALPFNTRARWDVVGGKFVDISGEDVPSIGLQGQITATDLMGVVGQICGSINDWEPFGGVLGELSGVNICYTPSQQQWTGNGMWETPTAIARFAGDIYATVALQNAASATTGELQGYKLQSFQIQFDHLNTSQFTVAGTVPGGTAKLDTEVKESGIPLGAGFYLQSLGGGFKNNLSTGTLGAVNGTIGVSIGPEFNFARQAINLMRFDGKAEIQPPQAPGDAWVYQLAGAATLGRLTPFELQLANGAVTYRADPNSPEGDFTFHLEGGVPVVGTLKLNITGQSDVPHGLAFEGTSSLTLLGHTGTNDVLLNAPYVGFGALPPGDPPAVLADCFTTNTGYETGFTIDFVSRAPKLGCNMSGLYHPHLMPQAVGSSASSAAAHQVTLRVPRGLKGTMLAIHGSTGPPKFTLSGPGLHIRTPASSAPRLRGPAMIFTDRVSKITYVALQAPRGGVYRLRTHRGSPAITRVLEANPLPQPNILARRVIEKGCTAKLSYRLTTLRGDRVLVYAQQGGRRTAIGYLRGGRRSLRIPLTPALRGRGKIIAYFLHGLYPFRVESRLAGFKEAGSIRACRRAR